MAIQGWNSCEAEAEADYEKLIVQIFNYKGHKYFICDLNTINRLSKITVHGKSYTTEPGFRLTGALLAEVRKAYKASKKVKIPTVPRDQPGLSLNCHYNKELQRHRKESHKPKRRKPRQQTKVIW